MEIQYVGVNDITPEEWFILHHDMDRRVMNKTPDSTFAVARIAGKLGLKINKELPQAEKVEEYINELLPLGYWDSLTESGKSGEDIFEQMLKITGEKVSTTLASLIVETWKKQHEADAQVAAKAWIKENDPDEWPLYNIYLLDALHSASKDNGAVFAYGYQEGWKQAMRSLNDACAT